MSNRRTLRDVEQLATSIGPWARQKVPEKISDTTFDTEVQRLDVPYLQTKLTQQVRDMHRSKMFKPDRLPWGVVTIDGKNCATLRHDAQGTGHRRSSENEKWQDPWLKKQDESKVFYLMPALRATLSSAEGKPCIYQMALPPGTGESTAFRSMVDALDMAYGRSKMFRLIDGDAGFTSLENATYAVEKGYDYLFGLKDNQPTLAQKANAYFLIQRAVKKEAPEAQTEWEPRNGKKMIRQLWRSQDFKGCQTSSGSWDHLQQVWYVRQETRHENGRIDIEERYFVTSLAWGSLSPKAILRVVRNHWAIENDVFNSLDLQWREDSAPWCSRGQAVWVLGLLRLMAYNLVQFCRKCHLRRKTKEGKRPGLTPWRELFEMLFDVMRNNFETDAGALTI
jgi:predicted transposase YbfD/YdcC